VRTAAYYHDIALSSNMFEHEAIGVRIARKVLPHFGYSPEHIQTICGIILVTQMASDAAHAVQEIMAMLTSTCSVGRFLGQESSLAYRENCLWHDSPGRRVVRRPTSLLADASLLYDLCHKPAECEKATTH